MPVDLTQLSEIVRLVRWYILKSTSSAGSGHPTSCLSAVELMTGLMFGGTFRADLNKAHHPTNDRLIFSKGHAAPLLYALYAAAGKLTLADLLKLRKLKSPLEGHPMPTFKYTEAPTGSLGQGLSIGLGQAIAAKMDKLQYRTYVLLGDSEMAEGSVWEAIQLAGHRKMDNLVGVLDVSRLGQSGPTMLGHDVQTHAKRMSAFGWKTIVIDGHNFKQILRAYEQAAATTGRPTMIIAKTKKGKGISFLENKEDWHGRALNEKELARALKEMEPVDRRVRGLIVTPPTTPPSTTFTKVVLDTPPRAGGGTTPFRYTKGSMVAPRLAFGKSLVRLAAAFPNMVVLDGEVKNSTLTELFADKYPKRFIETYIAEQNMVSMANGLAARGKIPVTATFAAFLSRAFDQLRMNQYAGTHQIYVGTHPGVDIGQDGPSQMGLQDIAMFRGLEHSVVVYPADAVSTERMMELALNGKGMIYVRATRADVPVIYDSKQEFRVGGSNVLRSSDHDKVTIVAAGITLFEALKAADILLKRKIKVRVIDLYSIKPIDDQTLRLAAQETRKIIVVEDHRPEGGIAEAVRSALGPMAGAVKSLAVTKTPHSGTPEELLAAQGIDAAAIVKAVGKR